MKKVLIILGIFGFLAVALFGLALMNLNSLIAELKPQLEKVASNAIGAPIEIGKIEASVIPSTRLRLTDLSSGQEKSDQKNNSRLKLDSIDLHVKLLPLLSGRLEIAELSVRKPEIHIIRSQSGVTIGGFPTKTKSANPFPPEAKGTPKSTGSMTSDSGAYSLQLEELTLHDGVLHIEDQILGKTFDIADVDISSGLSIVGDTIQAENSKLSASVQQASAVLGDISLSLPSALFHKNTQHLLIPKADLNLLGNAINVGTELVLPTLTGMLHLESSEVNLSTLKGILSLLQPLPVNDLRGVITTQGHLDFKGGKPFGELTSHLTNVGLSSAGHSISGLNGEVVSKLNEADIAFQLKKLSSLLNDQEVRIDGAGTFAHPLLSLRDVAMKGLGGTVNGSLSYNTDEKIFDTGLLLSNLSLGSALAVAKPGVPPNVKGTLEKAHLNLKGKLGENLLQSLSGQLDFIVLDSMLEGVNIGRDVLAKLEKVPLLAGAVLSQIPPEYSAILQRDHTSLKKLSGDLTLSQGSALIKDLSVLSDLFLLAGKGSTALQTTNLDLLTSLAFEPKLSTSLVGKVKELRNVLDEEGSLVLPVGIRGIPPKVIVYPDVEKLIEIAGKGIVRDKAKEAVEGLLDKHTKGKGKELLEGLLGF